MQLSKPLPNVLATPLMWVRGIYFVISKVPFLLLLILTAIFGFVINDQGMDLMAAFGRLSLIHPYVLSFIFLLMLWAGILWYVARIILTSANLQRIVDREVPFKESLSNPDCGKDCRLKSGHLVVLVDVRYRRNIQKLAKWVPRLMALLPYLIFIWGYLKVNGFRSGSVIQPVIVFLLATTHLIYLCYRTTVFKDKNQPLIRTNDRFLITEVTDLRVAVRSQRLINTTRYAIPLAFAGSFIYAWQTALAIPSLDGKPGLIILCGLIFYSLLGLLMDYISNRLKFPFFSLLLAAMLLVALPNNNNHELLQVKNRQAGRAQIDQRKTDAAYAREWLSQNWNRGRLYSKGDTLPVFIFAAEGGGIRACYWTTQVLTQLHLRHPELIRNSFAVTGASGGTVGLGFFYNYLFQLGADQDSTNQLLTNTAFYGPLDTLAAADYLSGVTYGFLFPDLIQRAIPFPVAAFDRAKFLNKGFSRAFARHTGSSDSTALLNQSLLAPWQAAGGMQRPVILYNSLFVEQGQKAIFSPFRLSEKYYKDVLDIFDTTGVMVPASEGMVSSSRFPIITPPGLLKTASGDKRGHLVDGGYFENTAVQTAQQTAILLRQVARQMDFGGKKLVPVIITLRYGSGIHVQQKALGWNYEIAPVQGGINTLFRWIDVANAITTSLDSTLLTIDFRLPRISTDNIPLGWYLSEPSRQLILRYANPDSSRYIRGPLQQLEKYLLP